MPPKRPTAASSRRAPAKSNRRAPKPKGPHAASTALLQIPIERTAKSNATTKPSVPKFDPITNIGKALRFRAQVEKAKKARARELEPSKNPLPPPDEFDLEAVEQEVKARQVAMRARTANMGGRVVRGRPMTNEQKREFFRKQVARREKKKKKALAVGGDGGVGGGEEDVVGAFIVEQTVSGSKRDMWARYHSQQRGGGEVVRNDARRKRPGVQTVLGAQGGGFQPLRWEKEG
ncbi:hypothetical protein TI39_contig258g00006 [Zymoseptoria brevis]|uniref:Uncharacterized protein n=1 Tax=Zymoseptoria brevis TaxID=1047168 RepID=A0A0F4GXZ0_9PEZI|nr:hypothetical protein TI39_contig258g00006 [Zymoseptoria brevis]